MGEPVPCTVAEWTDASFPATYPFLTTNPVWAEVYAPNGNLLKRGDIVYRKKFAKTLELSVPISFSPWLAPNTRPQFCPTGCRRVLHWKDRGAHRFRYVSFWVIIACVILKVAQPPRIAGGS